jgi:hypothetical protein
VRELLFDPRATEFIIVTIPTVKLAAIFAIAATTMWFYFERPTATPSIPNYRSF